MTSAIRRKRQLKRWDRPWKMEWVERSNPDWVDLYPSLCGLAPDPRVKPEDNGEGSAAAFLARLDRNETED